MDAKMRGNIVTGLMVLCLVLGLWGQFGNSWLTEESEDVDTGEEMEIDVSLSESRMKSDAMTEEECEDTADLYDDADLKGFSCDGDALVLSLSGAHENCEDALGDDPTDAEENGCDDLGAAASAGFTGGLILWFASVTALACTVLLIINIVGVELDAVPDKVGMILMWTAGSLTIFAVFLWYTMLPDRLTDYETGINTWMTVVGGIFALVAGGMDTFMADE